MTDCNYNIFIATYSYEPLDETTEIGKEQGTKSNFTTKPFKVAEIIVLAQILQAFGLTHASLSLRVKLDSSSILWRSAMSNGEWYIN